jgi:hypothetical protein
MDVLRLSDSSPFLEQLCFPCQIALRHGQFDQIKRSSTNKFGPRSLWSCQLCSVFGARPRSRRLGSTFLDNLLRKITKSKPNSSSISFHNGGNGNIYSSPVGDLRDLIVLGTELSRSKAMFNHPPVDILDTIDPFRKACKPVLRVIPPVRIDLCLVQEWLRACESKHSVCRNLSTSRHRHTQNQPGLILIDVKQKRLVEQPSSCRYFALSYVWGGVEQLKLTQGNRSDLEKANSLANLWDQIPRTIQDSISFIEAIEEKYLWVDTLCIVQDSESRLADIGRMNEIYQRAVCTLVALDGKNASDCLPGVRPNSRMLSALALRNDLLLARRCPELAISFAKSTYEQRAWTFQERLLSTRCLYFTREQLYFHCQSELWSEDRYEHFEQHADLYGSYPSLTWPSQSSPFKSMEDKMKVYISLVDQYSRRRLSFQSDRLNAFLGIASSYSEKWNWVFNFGIPLPALHLSLMWLSPTIVRAKISAEHQDHQLPSWSWVGWPGAVHYEIAKTHHPANFDIEMSQIDGSHQNRVVLSSNKYSSHETDHLPNFSQKYSSNFIPRPTLFNIVSFSTAVTNSSQYNFVATEAEVDHSRDGGHGKVICRILDAHSNECGILFDSGDAQTRYRSSNYQFVLMGISQSGFLINSLEDLRLDNETGHNVIGEHYKSFGGKVLNIMLIHWITEDRAERVTLGQIHQVAWEKACPRVHRITLQ